MDSSCTYIPYEKTNSFSKLVTDYLDNSPELQPFYRYRPDEKGIEHAIKERSKYPVNREALVSELKNQYKELETSQLLNNNITALAEENTYTICTAHQPNLLTGYLYFIYKITHAIKLAEELNSNHSDKKFVPVYYIGSEDNDLDELGVFRYNGDKYRWDADGQTGAVGRMDTKSLKSLLDELFRVLGPPTNHTKELKEILTGAYLNQKNIADATRYLVNELFGRYGLVVIDADSSVFKSEILNVLEDDLLNHTAVNLVNEQADLLAKNYKTQAYPRDINLFYLKDQIRERIEHHEDRWVVLNTDISFSKDELLKELKDHPERFSPNVILRGVLQESILPNVAFIGGGAEVAYWLQLEKVFKHYNVFYPAVMLRQSAMLVKGNEAELVNKLELSTEDIFKGVDELTRAYIDEHTNGEWKTDGEEKEVEEILNKLQRKAVALDPTLEKSAGAALSKMKHQLDILQKKMYRAEKRKMQVEINRYEKLKSALFPNGGLQERTENFIQYYPEHGAKLIDLIHKGTLPYNEQFLIIYL